MPDDPVTDTPSRVNRAALLTIVAAAACYRPTGEGDGGPSGPPVCPIQPVVDALVLFACDPPVGCAEASAAYLAAECPAQTRASLQPTADVLLADLDAGTVACNVESAQACLLETGNAKFCGSEVLVLGPGNQRSTLAHFPCPAAIVGLVPNGGSCLLTIECDAGFCSADVAGAVCPGSCAPFPSVGDGCGSDAGNFIPCGAGLGCALIPADGGDVLVCLAPLVAGAHCGLGTAGCVEGLICSQGSCALPGPASGPGGPCNDGFQCEQGLACDSETFACVVALDAGAPCDTFGDCAWPLVCAGYTQTFEADGGELDTAGQCAVQQDVGGRCAPPASGVSVSVTGCLPGLACVDAACQIPPTSGPCTVDPAAPCQPFVSYCDPASDSCLPELPVGAACSATLYGQDCASGYCDPTGHCLGPCGT